MKKLRSKDDRKRRTYAKTEKRKGKTAEARMIQTVVRTIQPQPGRSGPRRGQSDYNALDHSRPLREVGSSGPSWMSGPHSGHPGRRLPPRHIRTIRTISRIIWVPEARIVRLPFRIIRTPACACVFGQGQCTLSSP